MHLSLSLALVYLTQLAEDLVSIRSLYNTAFVELIDHYQSLRWDPTNTTFVETQSARLCNNKLWVQRKMRTRHKKLRRTRERHPRQKLKRPNLGDEP